MPKYILANAEVKQTRNLSEKKYPKSFRIIRYYDKEYEREFTFLTNATHVSALDIANLYKKDDWSNILQMAKATPKNKKILVYNGKRCRIQISVAFITLLPRDYCPTQNTIETINL